ncbi:uncharacterized protein [Pleurodeles waltl]|uniref:uncharacterized protein isoform X2 n=1 Tax=Pleurodeles waltl TaxID=8319 RepID=UPI00370952B1
MAVAEKELLLESFLKKRKDTMIFTWSEYWFRLRNTTLSFYTSKEADETCLRGKYYIHLVQSVREVKTRKSNYTFEIVMKNGKRKLLSADSAQLRKTWIEYLWKSMQLPSPCKKNSSCTWHDLPSLEQRAEAATLNKSDSWSDLDNSMYEQLSSSSDALIEGNKNNSEDGDSSGSNVPQLESDDEVTSGHAEQEHQSCDSDTGTNIYDVPKLKSEGECNKTDTGNKNKSEDGDSSGYKAPQLKDDTEVIRTFAEHENESCNSDTETNIYDVPKLKSEGECNKTDAEQENESCNSDTETNIYDVPKLKSEGECNKTDAGGAIDDIGEQSTDFDSLDEIWQ